MARDPEQARALELVWRASQDGAELTLSAEDVALVWRAFQDDSLDRLRLRDEVKRYRFEDPTIRTEAVKDALELVRRSGKSAVRNEDGTPSTIANIVGYSLNRGAEAVQQEIDHYNELLFD